LLLSPGLPAFRNGIENDEFVSSRAIRIDSMPSELCPIDMAATNAKNLSNDQ
jgi:hypothetical protein